MQKNKEFFFFYLSSEGRDLAESIKAFLGDGELVEFKKLKKEELTFYWRKEGCLIFIMALGIVARILSPLIRKKGEDPGVIVIDERGSNVIAYLGGHYAETNRLSIEIATFLKAHPVITTASDSKGLPALDLWIRDMRFFLKNKEKLHEVMSKYNKNGKLKIFLEKPLTLPLLNGLEEVESINEADIIITYKNIEKLDKLILVPRCLWAGIGFHDGLSEEDFEALFRKSFENMGLEFKALKGIATLEKKVDYLSLKNFALKHNLSLLGFEIENLSEVKTFAFSEYVFERFGIKSVSEASALLAGKGLLLFPKRVYQDFTIAISLEPYQKKGRLYVVGVGPGAQEYLTLQALRVLTKVSAVVGYKTYIKQIASLIKGKEIYEFFMTQEIDRVKKAIEIACQGKDTAIVSGGDPGIYGMSGLVLEILYKNKITLEVEIVPGVSALNVGNALIGAPLENDFAVISLSDRLTPWEVIEGRFKKLLESEIPLVIYNPSSQERKAKFQRVLEILKEKRPFHTPIAIINSATRNGEEIILSNLGEVSEKKVGMNSLVIIGSSSIEKLGRYLISQRGYKRKYEKHFKVSSTCL